ncbi:hypothetical protein cypCar_00042686 [Cyprinus carpio]|nr:hypothetical protein cypCar_00042686 [Cyprinus carpio]
MLEFSHQFTSEDEHQSIMKELKSEFIKEESENMSDLEPCRIKHTEEEQRVPDAIECEHLPTQIGYDDELQSGRDPDEDDEHADELP